MLNIATLKEGDNSIEFRQCGDKVQITARYGKYDFVHLTCTANDLFRIFMSMDEKAPTWQYIQEHGGSRFFYKNGYHLKEDDYVPKHGSAE